VNRIIDVGLWALMALLAVAVGCWSIVHTMGGNPRQAGAGH